MVGKVLYILDKCQTCTSSHAHDTGIRSKHALVFASALRVACSFTDCQARPYMAVGQNQWYHFGVGAPPLLVYEGFHVHPRLRGLVIATGASLAPEGTKFMAPQYFIMAGAGDYEGSRIGWRVSPSTYQTGG